MIILERLSQLQKQLLESLISDASDRLRSLQSSNKNDSAQTTQQRSKSKVQDDLFPAHDFVKMIYFMIREGLYGTYHDQDPGQTAKINYKILQQHLNFLQSTFYYPKIDTIQPRIKAFELKNTQNNEGLYRDKMVIQKIQKLAKHVFIAIEDYLSENYHQKLRSCPNNDKSMYLSPLYSILEDIQKNYVWERWKKQEILSEIKNMTDSTNRSKDLEELNFLEIIYVSYSRQALNGLRLKNKKLQEYINKLLQSQPDFKSQQQKHEQKSLQNQTKSPKSQTNMKIKPEEQKESLTSDIETNEIFASIEALKKVQKNLQMSQKAETKQKKSLRPSKQTAVSLQQIVLGNMEAIDYFTKMQENQSQLHCFMKVFDRDQLQKRN